MAYSYNLSYTGTSLRQTLFLFGGRLTFSYMSAANEFNKQLFIIANFDITEMKIPCYACSRYAVAVLITTE